MNRRSFLIGTGGLLAASSLSAPALAQSTRTIRLVQSNYGFLFVPAMVAQEMGYFQKNGLNAEFIVNLGGSEALAATLSGDADINVGATSSALRARERGTDAVIFGTSVSRYASNLVVSTDLAERKGVDGSSSLEDRIEALRGARIAVIGLGSGTHQLLLYLAQRGYLEPDSDLEIMGIGQTSSVLTAFEQGRIDGFIASSPSGEQAVQNYGGMMLINTTAGDIPELDNYPYVTYITRERWLSDNPDIHQAFVGSVNEALAALRDPETGAEIRELIYSRHHGQTDRAIFDAAWQTTLNAWPANCAVEREMGERAISFLNQFSSEPYPRELLDTAFRY